MTLAKSDHPDLVQDMPVYVVAPENPKGCVVVLQDIYSARVLHPNSRSGDRLGAICDTLGKTYSVAMPSIFRDTPFDLGVNGPDDGDYEKFDSFAQDGGVAWFQKQTYETKQADVQATVAYLQKKHPGLPIAVVGFCYGVWLLSKSSQDNTFCCGVGCHPATILETAVFGRDEVAMLQALPMPTKFLWAGNDSDIFIKDGAGKKALEATGGGVEEFPDMLHGWVSRGDMSDEKVKRDVDRALQTMTSFLEQHLRA